MCSIIVPADELNIHNQFKLVASVALACTAFIKIFLPVESSIKIKWPNDIYISDRKAGGILIENKIIGSKWRWVVVGVGINVNQTEFEGELAQHATSLKIETHQDFDVVTLVKELSKTITLDVANLPFVRDEEVMRSYNSLLYQKNKIVKLKKDNMVFETTIKTVDRGGNLLTSDVLDRAFTVNEVSWIL
jgi:BirA family biotin operon repressor/biotin-[acetyl-CoA-carboxylase] ligase